MPSPIRALFALSILTLILAPPAHAAAPGPTELGEGLQNPGYQEHPAWFKNSFLDIREDVADAAAAGKRVILYFYQDGCPYCAKLLQEGLADRRIGELARKGFDLVAINLWGDREVNGFSGEPTTEKQFAAGLRVQFTPTLLLLDEGGKVILRLNGYFPPQQLATALRYAAERRDQLGEVFADYAAAQDPAAASGKLHAEGGFLPEPLRLADNRDTSQRPLVVLFEQPTCRDCDELHQVILRKEPVAYSLTAFDGAIVNPFSRTRSRSRTAANSRPGTGRPSLVSSTPRAWSSSTPPVRKSSVPRAI